MKIIIYCTPYYGFVHLRKKIYGTTDEHARISVVLQ